MAQPATHQYVQPRLFNRVVSIDSSQNPAVKVVLFAVLTGTFLLLFVALCSNEYSSYTLSEPSRDALLAMGAAPDNKVTAGVVGASGINPQGAPQSTYVCSACT